MSNTAEDVISDLVGKCQEIEHAKVIGPHHIQLYVYRRPEFLNPKDRPTITRYRGYELDVIQSRVVWM